MLESLSQWLPVFWPNRISNEETVEEDRKHMSLEIKKQRLRWLGPVLKERQTEGQLMELKDIGLSRDEAQASQEVSDVRVKKNHESGQCL